MIKDTFSAVWLSYSSISDYLKCPRAYYLKNIYRDPRNNHKISLIQPPLALGQVVHDVIDSISKLPAEKRFERPLTEIFDTLWKNVRGKKGGFISDDEEQQYKQRGNMMIARIIANPGIILTRAIKIRQDLPYYWFSEDDNIILCGKIDWLEYCEKEYGVRIIDFKTGKFDEDPNSLQLPMYLLLSLHCQTHPVIGAQYWYLDRDDAPIDVQLPNESDAIAAIREIAKTIVLARKLERFVCPHREGCAVCRPYEAIIAGKAHHVGVNQRNQDMYIL